MIHIIANPRAGGGRAVASASGLARGLADAGIPCHVHVTSSREDTIAASRTHAARGIVVACGGDGTVHDCLQGVMTSGSQDKTMAIWPVGTGNDIARGLGLTLHPIDFTHFIEAVIDNAIVPVDVGVVGGGLDAEGDRAPQFFLGVLSCGFDSDVNERANAMPARVGRARYLLGLARELPIVRPRWYSIDSDGQDRSMAAMVVAIGNGPAYGSGMLICPEANMTDGQLDVTVVTNTPKHTFVSVLPKVYSGRHVEHPSVVSWRATRLRIDAPDAIVFADGERVGPLPVTIEVLASAVRVLTPRADLG
ncbi:MAG: diacylglycerol/lipid kinase family protein [Candidatus Nanopelagicales bacterium]